MKPIDLVLLAVLAVIVCLALRRILSGRGKCNCGCGCGTCSGCDRKNVR